MRIWLIFFFWTTSAFAYYCNCEVRVFHPTTVSQKLSSANMKEYRVESFDSLSVRNQYRCRRSCLKEFEKDLPSERIQALLVNLSQALINEGVAGFNCTGLTTFRYPVRVKANLGGLSLGNVTERMEVISHEEACF